MDLRLEFGAWVRFMRTLAGMKRIDLAESARVDLSTITAIESGGHVPKSATVIRISASVCGDVDEALLRAGYAPITVSVDHVLRLLGRDRLKNKEQGCLEKGAGPV